VRNALRPELVNRFDRVVVFRPLSRDVMRGIVRREIDAVFERRGLASREWAVEVDESAVDFLLDRGFTVDMGARPLARAVERHLLAPLARAIVTHQAPRGEQFLLVTADTDTLDVAFVAADPAPAAAAPDGAEGERTVRDVARDPDGSRADLHVLRLELDACRTRVRDAVWEETKDAALLETARPGFWDEPDRFAILGRAEVMDRIEAQVRSGASLLDRLFALARTDEVRIDPGPVARLARELLQVRSAIGSTMADEPQDALLVVDGGAEIGKELAAMYAAWAARAGAVVHKLAQRREPYRRAFLLEGLGVHATLAPEAGVHVLERSPHRKVRRVAAAEVLVAPWPGLPGDDAAAAAAALTPATGTPVVRRYQHDPTPLVRDRVRGYRTGRIDHVLSGGFDLF
jgi:ATP-dependent Clp protease ATP-binding subunit ClpC